MKLKTILATDCGSTTTKAILIELVENEYRLTYRGEAPTTVEAPFEDVTRGVLNAVMEIEELSNRKIINKDKIISPSKNDNGVDIYISTSSAGGGLQMMVAGVVKTMSGESAERAALGAGSIVMDIIASNDGRLPHEKIKRIRELRPDMILLSGGIDGGTVSHVVELAEILAAAYAKKHPVNADYHKGYFAHAQARQLSKFENPQMLLYESPSIACLNQNNAAKEQLFHLGNPRGHKLFQHDLVISSHLPFSNLTYR